MNQDLEHKRHTLAHLLAAAIMELYPDAKRTIGPAIDDGFYFDFDFPTEKPSEKDFPKIEKVMRKLLPSWKEFVRTEYDAAAAKAEYPGNQYKHELIDEFTKDGEKVSFYKSGNYSDLCRGGHVDNPSKDIVPDSWKLDRIAGAYWRGSEKNAMLTRIYALAFDTKSELDEFLRLREEAEKRNHKKLGTELELLMFHETSPGMPYWLPKGVVMYNELVDFWRVEHRNRGYQEIVSPILNKKELYITSGHYEHYWPDMFVANMGENEEYGVKPMNCPNAMVVFGSRARSYRELPLRLSDIDPIHRYERSGTLNGLLRVREFKQDDAHIYISEDQIGEEYLRVFDIVDRFYSIFGMKYWFRLGTRPESFMGDIETWDMAEATLKDILKQSGKEYFILEGDGAFYGPKVDILMKDAIGREWQMGTIQLDFQQPRRFNLEYVAKDGTRKTPVAIHRVIYGSIERFIGILIEHYAGAFPLWLSPVMVKVLPVSEKHNAYGQKIHAALKDAGLRAELDEADESLGKKIRNAKQQKVPYIFVVGEKEETNGTVGVETRAGSEGEKPLDQMVERLKDEYVRRA
jgi:threonyl-tRNA synthetase